MDNLRERVKRHSVRNAGKYVWAEVRGAKTIIKISLAQPKGEAWKNGKLVAPRS